MEIERRKYPRKKVSVSTNILETNTENVLGECILTDISKNGFAIESEANLSVGQHFNLMLTILNQTVFLSGQVVRVADGFFYQLYGAKIIDEESKNLDFLRRYIDYSLN